MHFKGPFHFEHIQHLKKNNKIENGIYIWGFIYEFDEKGLTKPVDYRNQIIPFQDSGIKPPNNQKFIPYYVGMRTKYEVFDRLIDHHGLTGRSTKKYTRLSYPFLKEFFKGINRFPINPDESKMMTFLAGKVAKNFVEYFNSETVLHTIYPSPPDTLVLQGTEKDWPINLQKVNGNSINDTLEQLIHPKNGKNNFWFCYADANLSNKITIEDAETSTFWALKGLTISQIKGDKSVSITAEESCKQIFKHIGDTIQSEIFSEKLFADPDIFPGY